MRRKSMSYDSFRQKADDDIFQEPQKPAENSAAVRTSFRARRRRGNFLGMTAVQRFIIAAMILIMTCLLGTFCLLVTQRIVPPV
jgi:hypothetical protein